MTLFALINSIIKKFEQMNFLNGLVECNLEFILILLERYLENSPSNYYVKLKVLTNAVNKHYFPNL